METHIQVYEDILTKVQFIASKLKWIDKKKTGRPIAVKKEVVIALALYKHLNGIPTKKKIHETFKPKCSYKTLVVQMNSNAVYALYILKLIMHENIQNSTLVKHTDSTDIPICLNKNAKYNKTMKDISVYSSQYVMIC